MIAPTAIEPATCQLVNLKHKTWIGYDPDIPDAMWRHLSHWFEQIRWDQSDVRELPQEVIDALYYMARVEGYVCGGYLLTVLLSSRVRSKTSTLDFVAGAWAPDENGHSLALYAFLDHYFGRMNSSRSADLDARRSSKLKVERIKETLTNIGAVVGGDAFVAAYAVVGYRNEIMTQRGYACLRSKVNQDGEHPVLSPLLKFIMEEESDHAKTYKRQAKEALEGNPQLQQLIRRFLKKWPGIVGEGFGGTAEADKVVRYLFEDASGRDMLKQVDWLVGELPGLKGVTPTKDRLEIALANR